MQKTGIEAPKIALRTQKNSCLPLGKEAADRRRIVLSGTPGRREGRARVNFQIKKRMLLDASAAGGSEL